MASGVPLDDADWWPWLDIVGTYIAGQERIVVACSALCRAYRDRLPAARADILFIHLHTTRAVLASRIASREDHFMPPSPLDTQLSTLEPLEHDDRGVIIDVEPSLAAVVDSASEWFSRDA